MLSFFKTIFLFMNICSLLFTLGAEEAISSVKPSLAIYLTSLQPVHILKSKISNLAPGVEVSVFAKYRDYEDFVRTRKPDFLIGYSDHTLDKNYESIELGDKKSTKSEDKYLLVALGAQVESKKKWRLGLVEFTEEHSLKNIVEKNMKRPISILRTVAKPIDLFPLLVFQSVDVILVEEKLYRQLAQKFSTKTLIIGSLKWDNKPVAYGRKDILQAGQEKLFEKSIWNIVEKHREGGFHGQ